MHEQDEDITVIVPSTRNTQDPEAGNMPSDKAEQTASVSGRTVKISTLILICLLCSLLSGALCLVGYNLAGNKTTLNNEAGTTSPSTLMQNNTHSGPVTIEVENVSAPATAVAKKVLPSIVGIQVTVTSNSSWYGQTTKISSEGSGVVFSQDGYIITNYHVIEDTLTSTGEASKSANLNIYLYSDPNTAIKGTVIGYDISADLAVVKIDRNDLTPVELGDSDKLQVGDITIALGNPGGLQFLGSVSQGIISGLNRTIPSDGAYENLSLIQTDAAINPGNSGGALMDIQGKLIGINSAKLVAKEYEGMGFAIPVNDVFTICTEIIKNGNRKVPYLGAELSQKYTASYLEQLGYPGGVLVESVYEDSPAAEGGIQAEDILISFNGVKITNSNDLKQAKNDCKTGDTVIVQVFRLTQQDWFGRWSGEYIDISVTLG